MFVGSKLRRQGVSVGAARKGILLFLMIEGVGIGWSWLLLYRQRYMEGRAVVDWDAPLGTGLGSSRC